MGRWLSGAFVAGMCVVVSMMVAPACQAADYRVEALKESPPSDGLSAEIAAQLSPTGFKVLQGDQRVVCEIWPAKQWATKADFAPSDTVLYPLEVGGLVGVLRFTRKGADFRGQEIPAGLYTLRYANQPVDGNHVGTFETRDFLLMLPASADQSASPMAEADLFTTSAQSAESSHPAIMPVVKATAGEPGALRHLEEQEWWVLRLVGKGTQGAKVPLEVIVVGKSAE